MSDFDYDGWLEGSGLQAIEKVVGAPLAKGWKRNLAIGAGVAAAGAAASTPYRRGRMWGSDTLDEGRHYSEEQGATHRRTKAGNKAFDVGVKHGFNAAQRKGQKYLRNSAKSR